MPIYEYDCPTCGVIEVTQRITAPTLSKCPTCKRKVTKLISATSFQLKGEGWYVTDYARKGNGKTKGTDAGGGSEGGDGKPAAASDSASGTKSDAKADTKPKADAKASGSSTSSAKSDS